MLCGHFDTCYNEIIALYFIVFSTSTVGENVPAGEKKKKKKKANLGVEMAK